MKKESWEPEDPLIGKIFWIGDFGEHIAKFQVKKAAGDKKHLGIMQPFYWCTLLEGKYGYTSIGEAIEFSITEIHNFLNRSRESSLKLGLNYNELDQDISGLIYQNHKYNTPENVKLIVTKPFEAEDQNDVERSFEPGDRIILTEMWPDFYGFTIPEENQIFYADKEDIDNKTVRSKTSSLHFSTQETITEESEIEKRDPKKQVKADDVKPFLDKLDEKGIKWEFVGIPIKDITPLQKEIKREKVDNIKKKIKKGEELPPVIVAKDNHLADGHHRMIAMEEEKGKDALLPSVKVDADFDTVWDMMEKLNKKASMKPESGWIDPYGEFIPLTTTVHYDDAYFILKKIDPNFFEERDPAHSAYILLHKGYVRVRYDNALFFIGIGLKEWKQPQISSVIEYLSQFKDHPHLRLYIETSENKTIFDGQVGDFLRHETLAGLKFSWEPQGEFYSHPSYGWLSPEGRYVSKNAVDLGSTWDKLLKEGWAYHSDSDYNSFIFSKDKKPTPAQQRFLDEYNCLEGHYKDI